VAGEEVGVVGFAERRSLQGQTPPSASVGPFQPVTLISEILPRNVPSESIGSLVSQTSR
jgi:hypothetical protein